MLGEVRCLKCRMILLFDGFMLHLVDVLSGLLGVILIALPVQKRMSLSVRVPQVYGSILRRVIDGKYEYPR